MDCDDRELARKDGEEVGPDKKGMPIPTKKATLREN
jgi:hypothetical protein